MIKIFDYIFYVLGAMVNMGAAIYIWTKLEDNKENISKLKIMIAFTILVIINCLIYFNVKTSIRLWIVSGIFVLSNIFLFKNSIKEAIVKMLFSQSIMMISELAVCLIFVLLFNSSQIDLVNNYFGTFIANIIISVFAICICNLKILKKTSKIIIKFVNRIDNYIIIIICLLFLFTIDILFSLLYYENNFKLILIFHTFLTVLSLIILIISIKVNNKYNDVNNKYITTISTLRDYEKLINDYRVINHENKNTLLTIRGMLSCNDSDIKQHIDALLCEERKDNTVILKEVFKIPKGGLRGLIYSKLNIMQEKEIQYNLNVRPNVAINSLIEISDNTMVDLCKIVGVFIDNAIEEVENKTNKKINIEIYKNDKNICISVANLIDNNINLKDINRPGFTTKSKGHGYGLSLVKKILNKNKKLSNRTIISKDIFTQELLIDL